MRHALIGALALTGVMLAIAVARADEIGNVTTTVFVNPLLVDLKVTPPTTQVGKPTSARLTVRNNAPRAAGAVTATLIVDPGITIAGPATQTAPGIDRRSKVDFSWQLCGASPGSYLAMAIVTSSMSGHDLNVETEAVLIEVKSARRGAPC